MYSFQGCLKNSLAVQLAEFLLIATSHALLIWQKIRLKWDLWIWTHKRPIRVAFPRVYWRSNKVQAGIHSQLWHRPSSRFSVAIRITLLQSWLLFRHTWKRLCIQVTVIKVKGEFFSLYIPVVIKDVSHFTNPSTKLSRLDMARITQWHTVHSAMNDKKGGIYSCREVAQWSALLPRSRPQICMRFPSSPDICVRKRHLHHRWQ